MTVVKYVGPHDEVEFEDGRQVKTCQRNKTVEVSSTCAGEAPNGDNPGSGLLAQPSNWQNAATVKGSNK